MNFFSKNLPSASWEKIIVVLREASSFIRRWPRSAALILAVALLMTAWFWKRLISGAGGLPILGRIEIPVAPFFQEDPRWTAEVLGTSSCDTLGSAGCAVSSAAMVLASYGVMVDPKKLNQYLISHNGYESDSWIKWEVASDYPPGIAEHMYEAIPSYGLIDWNLLCGNPVIVRIRRASGKTHFVVIVGKQGFNYLIRDPGTKGLQGVYPFSQLGAPIEALRFYRKKKEEFTTNVQPAGRPLDGLKTTSFLRRQEPAGAAEQGQPQSRYVTMAVEVLLG